MSHIFKSSMTNFIPATEAIVLTLAQEAFISDSTEYPHGLFCKRDSPFHCSSSGLFPSNDYLRLRFTPFPEQQLSESENYC